MSENWSFDQLDLSDVEADSGEIRLKPGRYVCKITHASLEKVSTNAKGRRLQLEFVSTSGHGSIKESINLNLPGSPEAEKIGKKQLKTLLTHAKHPTPDNPGDVSTIVGLEVGVFVAPDTFVNDKGETIKTSSIHGWHPYFDPTDAVNLGPTPEQPKANGAAGQPHPNQTGSMPLKDKDFDDIPF